MNTTFKDSFQRKLIMFISQNYTKAERQELKKKLNNMDKETYKIWGMSFLMVKKPGVQFGEQSLDENPGQEPNRRNATCLAHTDVYLAVLDKEAFLKILKKSTDKIQQTIINHISKFSVFSKLILSQKKKIAYEVQEIELQKDQWLIKEGDPVNYIYFLIEGDFERYKRIYSQKEPHSSTNIKNKLFTLISQLDYDPMTTNENKYLSLEFFDFFQQN